MIKAMLSLLCVLLLVSTLPGAAIQEEGFNTQTILVYIVGSDLESNGSLATKDIMEMIRSNYNRERLTVLLMTGGSASWGNAVIKPGKLGIYTLDRRGPLLLEEQPLRSMGEADTLANFLRYAKQNHPADSYGLILWDHGGGPMIGFGVDTLHQKDGLTLLELRQALDNSPFQGEERLEWLAFDACLMATVEVGLLMAPHAKYMIASEETLPGEGFAYGFLKPLGEGHLDGKSVGRLVIDHAHDFYDAKQAGNPNYKPLVTLSLIDLDQVARVGQAVDALFGQLNHTLDLRSYSALARTREGTKAYGLTSTGDYYDLVDLYDLVNKMDKADPGLREAVMSALVEAVPYNRSNVSHSEGLALYFPFASKKNFEARWRELYGDFGILPDYHEFIGRFGDILLADALSSWKGEHSPGATYDELAGSYQLQLSPQQVANYDHGEYYILARLAGEQYRLIFVSQDVTLDEQGRLSALFDGRVLHIAQGKEAPMLLPFLRQTEQLDGLANYQIPMLLQRRNIDGSLDSTSGQLLAQLDKAGGLALLTGAILDDHEGTQMGKRDTDLSAWDSLGLPYLSYYLTKDEDGNLLTLGDWAVSDDLFVMAMNPREGLKLSYEKLKPDALDYFVMMAVLDTQGNVYPSKLMPYLGNAGSQQGQVFPEKPPVREVSLNLEHFEPLLLEETTQGLRLTLMGVEFTADQVQGRVAPDTLHLQLLAENTTKEDLSLALDWLSVNAQMMYVQAFTELPPGGNQLLTLSIDIAPNESGTSLVDLGISQVEDLRFALSYSLNQTVLTRTHTTREFHITANFPVGAGYEAPQREAFEPILASDTQGLRIEQTGPLSSVQGRLVLPLKITNNSTEYDLVRLVDSSVNGIMARMTLDSGIVMPGSVLYTQASIPLRPMELPQEYEEFRELLDTEDNLMTLGITQVQELSLRFEMDIRALEHDPGRMNLAAKSDYINLYLDNAPNEEQKLDVSGDTLFEGEVLVITRLHSDPYGRLLFVKNRSQKSLTLQSFGMVKVDGEDYSLNQPIRLRLAPGSVAYHRLFSFLPGIFPEGEKLDFRLTILDTDDNRLLLRTEPIVLTLY